MQLENRIEVLKLLENIANGNVGSSNYTYIDDDSLVRVSNYNNMGSACKISVEGSKRIIKVIEAEIAIQMAADTAALGEL